MEMKVRTRHFQRDLTMETWSRGEERSLVVIRSPAREAGSATLRTPKGLWTYAPRADRMLRIPSGMLSESWMGSHFTNDDLLRDSSWEEDFDTTLTSAIQGGKAVLIITSIPKPDTAIVYSKVTQILDAHSHLPLRADYYDGDKIARTMEFLDVKTFSGKKLPSRLRLVPTDKPNESTEIIYREMVFDQPIDESLFTARGLRKMARQR